jgi:hypothetical protein
MTDQEELDALNKALEYWEREDCIANTLDAQIIHNAAQAYAKHHATIKAIESGDWVLVPTNVGNRIGEEFLRTLFDPSFETSYIDRLNSIIVARQAMLSASPKIGGE